MTSPERIVSLLPSATEILCALGLRERLVGVSHECDFPAEVIGLPVVTHSHIAQGQSSRAIDTQVREHLQNNAALYSLDATLLRQLHPDLIVTQALCDVCAVSADDVQAAACDLATVAEVVNLEPTCLEDVLATIMAVGAAAGVTAMAAEVVAGLRSRLHDIARRTEQAVVQRPTVVMLEWLDPPFNAGHWTPELVRYAGGVDCLGGEGLPSHTLEWQQIVAADPDVLVVACCGFDLPRTMQDVQELPARPGWHSLAAVRNNRVFVIDGNHYFNRPGPRLIDSLEILSYLLHPELFDLPRNLAGTYIHFDVR